MNELIIDNFTKNEEEFQQFQYLLRFLNNNIISCKIDHDKIKIDHTEKITIHLEKLVQKLTKRISGGRNLPFKSQIIHEHSVQPPYVNDIFKQLIDQNIIVKNHEGIFTFRPPFSDLILFLDQLIVDYVAKPLGAVNEYYPTLISMDTLNKTNHFTSFPHHVLFTQHLEEELTNIDMFTENVRANEGLNADMIKPNDVRTTSLVKNPAVCYHCYQSLENKEVPNEGSTITSVGRCSRYESNNHSDFGRLLDFSMREIIFIGSDEYVKSMREKSIILLKEFLNLWEIDSFLENANDPFFTNDYKVKSFFQRDLDMKYELKFKIPYLNSSISVSSSNYHGNVFGQAFSIKNNNEFASTSCMAFGLERWIFAFLAQYGLDTQLWPEKIKELFSMYLKR
ncbi:hypothetical protein ACFMB7_26855 [Bacillus toyonensis]